MFRYVFHAPPFSSAIVRSIYRRPFLDWPPRLGRLGLSSACSLFSPLTPLVYLHGFSFPSHPFFASQHKKKLCNSFTGPDPARNTCIKNLGPGTEPTKSLCAQPSPLPPPVFCVPNRARCHQKMLDSLRCALGLKRRHVPSTIVAESGYAPFSHRS